MSTPTHSLMLSAIVAAFMAQASWAADPPGFAVYAFAQQKIFGMTLTAAPGANAAVVGDPLGFAVKMSTSASVDSLPGIGAHNGGLDAAQTFIGSGTPLPPSENWTDNAPAGYSMPVGERVLIQLNPTGQGGPKGITIGIPTTADFATGDNFARADVYTAPYPVVTGKFAIVGADASTRASVALSFNVIERMAVYSAEPLTNIATASNEFSFDVLDSLGNSVFGGLLGANPSISRLLSSPATGSVTYNNNTNIPSSIYPGPGATVFETVPLAPGDYSFTLKGTSTAYVSALPEPGTNVALAVAAVGGAVWLRRRRPSGAPIRRCSAELIRAGDSSSRRQVRRDSGGGCMPMIHDVRFVSSLLGSLSWAIVALVSAGPPAEASTVTFLESGTSIEGHPLAVRAVLTGTGTTLTIDLFNEGPASRGAKDILTSFYFNIADPRSGIRPRLTYVSGRGQAYRVTTTGTDQSVSWTPQTLTGSSALASNLIAVNPGDQGWQFKAFDPPATVPPTLGYGLGTVGNSSLAPLGINFNGNVVSGNDPGRTMINLGIYSLGTGTSGIVATGAIINSFLIRNHAEFTFLVTGTEITSLNPFDASWVGDNVTWGFGTAPETLFLPEPASNAVAAAAFAAGIGWFVRRRTARYTLGHHAGRASRRRPLPRHAAAVDRRRG